MVIHINFARTVSCSVEEWDTKSPYYS